MISDDELGKTVATTEYAVTDERVSHPAIVPVYDLGEAKDGGARYSAGACSRSPIRANASGERRSSNAFG